MATYQEEINYGVMPKTGRFRIVSPDDQRYDVRDLEQIKNLQLITSYIGGGQGYNKDIGIGATGIYNLAKQAGITNYDPNNAEYNTKILQTLGLDTPEKITAYLSSDVTSRGTSRDNAGLPKLIDSPTSQITTMPSITQSAFPAPGQTQGDLFTNPNDNITYNWKTGAVVNDPKNPTTPVTSSGGKSPLELTQSIQNQGQPNTPQSSTTPVFNLTAGNLSEGTMNNENVRQLQTLLGVTPDGDFGPQTKAAVVAFQKANGLTPDGIVGPLTAAALAKQGGQVLGASTGISNAGTSNMAGAGATTTPNAPVGTSTPARTEAQTRAAEIQKIKDELEQGTDKPELYQGVEEYNKLRKEQGIVKDEEELSAIRNEYRQAQEEMRIFKSQNAKEITMGGFTGAVSEAERNANFRLEGLAIREQAVLDRVNTKNAYIQTVLQLGQQDYNTAKTAYDDEYNKNLKAIELFNAQESEEKKDALTGFTTMANLLSQSGLTTLTPQISTQLDAMALKAGLQPGIFQTALKGITGQQRIDNMKVVDDNLYMVTSDANGNPSLKLIKGGGGGTSPSGSVLGISTYKVQAGDTFKTLAEKNGTTVEALRMANPGVNENNLQVGQNINLSDPGESNFLQTLLNTKGGKALTDTSIQKLDKGLTVLGQIGVLQSNIQDVKTGPIVGAFKGANPWDENAQIIKASLNAVVPNLARGVYGEVGVLTDNDIKNYSKTLPTLTSTEGIRNGILYITLDMIGKSIKNTLNVNAAAGRDVSGFIDIYTEMEATKNSILQSIPGSDVPKAFSGQVLGESTQSSGTGLSEFGL